MSKPTIQIVIRKSTEEDWPKILDLYNSLSEEDLEFRFMNLHRLTIDEAKQISEPDSSITYLALKDETVIGEASLEEDGEISVVVSKDYRKEGVGVSLIKRLIRAARLKEMKRVKFLCTPSNSLMARLGSFLGFKLLKHFEMEDEWVLNL